MKSELRKVDLTDELIREAVKLELEPVDVIIPSEAWQRVEAELAQPRGTSAKRTFLLEHPCSGSSRVPCS
jgi:hypothetical protein